MPKGKIQSVEPMVADLVNGWLKSYNLNYKLEQESLNTDIDNALDEYLSKSGGKGGTRPDVKLLLDSNIYINFYDRYYRNEFFPTFWLNFVSILNSDVKVPDIVVSENYQEPWFRDWLDDNYEKDLIDHKSYAREWSEVIQYIQDSPLYKDTALSSEKGWANEKIADPWLIAIAKSENYTIVTDEIKNINLNAMNTSKNAKVPDVCEELNVRCISMNQFFEEIGLSI